LPEVDLTERVEHRRPGRRGDAGHEADEVPALVQDRAARVTGEDRRQHAVHADRQATRLDLDRPADAPERGGERAAVTLPSTRHGIRARLLDSSCHRALAFGRSSIASSSAISR
jgi:hypothetical protein